MALLTKDQILGADDLKTIEVEVPEWGGSIRLRTMTGTARDIYEQILISSRSKDKTANIENIRSLLLAFCIVDESNELMFSQDDIAALGKKSIQALDRLYDKAAELNALRDEDVDALAKNSEAAQTDDSTSS